MRVTVKVGEPLRRAVGSRKIVAELPEGATVADLLFSLADGYPGFRDEFYRREIDLPYALFLNEHQIKLDEVGETPVSEGDTLFIFLPVAGGVGLSSSRLGRDFYARDTLVVARELLGKRLVRVIDGGRLSGLIVETEAYIGEEDRACHASRGRTPRTEVMYGPSGYAYIYFIYGMHHCLNVVTDRLDFPAAVLIRGIQPEEGVEYMHRNRGFPPEEELTNGPGKLCQALAINRSLNGLDLCQSDLLFIEEAAEVDLEIEVTPRIGIRADEIAKRRPWRFLLGSKV